MEKIFIVAITGKSRQREESRQNMASGLNPIMRGERRRASKREVLDQERQPGPRD